MIHAVAAAVLLWFLPVFSPFGIQREDIHAVGDWGPESDGVQMRIVGRYDYSYIVAEFWNCSQEPRYLMTQTQEENTRLFCYESPRNPQTATPLDYSDCDASCYPLRKIEPGERVYLSFELRVFPLDRPEEWIFSYFVDPKLFLGLEELQKPYGNKLITFLRAAPVQNESLDKERTQDVVPSGLLEDIPLSWEDRFWDSPLMCFFRDRGFFYTVRATKRLSADKQESDSE